MKNGALRLVAISMALLGQEAPAPLPSKGKGGPAGSIERQQIKVDDADREYGLAVPEGLDPAKAVPLVFVFHGRNDSQLFIRRYSGFEDLAMKSGFIAVFPSGVDRQWDLRGDDDNKDLKFFDALLEHLGSKYNVDLRRVHLTGMSMGGYFSHLLAAKRSEKIAAIAPHSGGLGVLSARGVKAKRKFPVMVIHGEADKIVKVSEGRAARDLYQKEGHVVEYVEIEGLGHVWARKQDITDRIWKFFSSHPMK